MRRGVAWTLGIVLMFGMISAGVKPVFSQEEMESPYSELTGEVVSVDVAKSTVVVKYLADETTEKYENITLTVSEASEIVKGSDNVKLSDLKAGDKVDVEYTTDADGKKVAEGIFVESAT